MRLLVALFVLLFTQWFSTSATASPAHKANAEQRKSPASHHTIQSHKKHAAGHHTSAAHADARKKQHHSTGGKHAVAHPTHTHPPKVRVHHVHHAGTEHPHRQKTPHHIQKTHGHASASKTAHHAASVHHTSRHSSHLSAQHKKHYLHARQTAMNKLMRQIGKPYHWGGTSPHTGFDCSGLVYYAYQDLLNIKIPRTANEMYHLRDAAPVKRAELQRGDLVFFQIHGRGSADHVGVYLGNGKFIQSPRTGEDIRVSYLSDNYWQDHYLGARRVMTPKTIR